LKGTTTTLRSARLRLVLLGGLALLFSCQPCSPAKPPAGSDFAEARQRLVGELRDAGIMQPAVLAAIGRTPREEFVLPRDRDRAYLDRALPIEREQTISQPWVVARMTELLEVGPEARVLEVGTGSGYQAAVLASIVSAVFTIEIDPELAASSRERLERLGYTNVHVRAGDGFYGWPENAPFDAAIITAAAPKVPPLIVQQLKEGGTLVMPLDDGTQQYLVRGRKRGNDVPLERIAGVVFVPMTGAVRK
jgi:protein-L-isoaspartate(D-aspartate) O-methyltransferase